jgi:hypothetical protein
MSKKPQKAKPEPEAVNYNWIVNVYFPALSQEKASALDQLHNATNWGLTLVTTAFLLAVTKQGFPDTLSLLILLIALLMGFHFFTRTLKGYINVIRWALLQRDITEDQLRQNSTNQNEVVENIVNLIKKYHVNWWLPLRRRDVIIKGLFELGYGYILSIILATIIYVFFSMPMKLVDWIGSLVGLFTIGFELILFLRSPYMKTVVPHDNARKLR